MRKILLFTVFFFAAAGSASAQNFVSPEQLKGWIEDGKVILVDIQPAEDYMLAHLRGALATFAYPVETSDDKERLKAILPTVQTSGDRVVILRPPAKPGRLAAFRAYQYFQDHGVSESRLYLLNGGLENWPYPEMIEKAIPAKK